MSSIIRATTTSGLQVAPDNSGSLVLQTNDTTTALTIDTSQNVGIGTNSLGFANSPLGVYATAPTSGIAATISANSSNGSFVSLVQSGTYSWGIGMPAGSSSLTFVGNKYVGNAGTEYMRIDSSGNVGIGTSSPTSQLAVQTTAGSSTGFLKFTDVTYGGDVRFGKNTGISNDAILGTWGANNTLFYTNSSERMRIDTSGQVIVGKTSNTFGTQGAVLNAEGAFYNTFTRSSGSVISVNRTTNDGTLVEFAQDGTVEGTISVSGTTVSYNGGHLSRWSQWQNETGQPNVYRGTVLESVNAMCEWEKDGEPLPNEQATKTIISNTIASKAVAGVFDRYDEDDETNPYDFFVAQSGDFVIRIAQGVVVQNGDLLESAGDGTAKPQADDICRSSTIAKVTSNYVSVTYEDGSYCVPCILMIG